MSFMISYVTYDMSITEITRVPKALASKPFL